MKRTLKVINELKEKGLINNYAIGGGIAALFYIEPFLTYDLGVFIIPVQRANQKDLILLSDVFDYLRSMGYHLEGGTHYWGTHYYRRSACSVYSRR